MPVLQARGLVKRYGNVTALDGCDFEVLPGEILAVIGDNGAGKSSLIKALSGATVPDEGEILLDGKPVKFRSPLDARAQGIETVYQELAVAPAMSIAENLFLARELLKPGWRGSLFKMIDKRRMAREIDNVSYFKIETPQAANKLRELIELGGDAIVGPWDGEEAITLMADLDAGATGSMTGGGYADGIRLIVDAYAAGDTEAAAAHYQQWLPLINYENRQGGLASCKALMKEGGVIGSDAVRHPLPQMHPATREGLLKIARRLDPLVLRWSR